MKSCEVCTTHKTHSPSQPWWWCGDSSAGALKDEKTNWASSGPGPKTSMCLQTKTQLDQTTINEMEITLSPHPGGKSGVRAEKSSMQTSGFMVPILNNELLSPSPAASPSELVAPHSMACTSYSYHDACCAALMPPLGIQTLVQSSGILHPGGRLALPLQMAEEPVYVNAKQYHGILRRRQSRAKAEVERRIIRQRKPYLHESRHLHAMRRERGCGGRFLSKKKVDESGSSHHEKPSNESSVSSSSELSFININAVDSYHHRQLMAQPPKADGSCYQTSNLLHLSAYI